MLKKIDDFIALTPTYEKALNETMHHRRRRIVKLSAVGEGAELDKRCRRIRRTKISAIGEGTQ